MRYLLPLLTAACLGCPDGTPADLPEPPAVVDGTPVPRLTVPDGFEVFQVTDDVPNARAMTWGPDGVLFVGTRADGRVYAVTGLDDHAPDEVLTLDEDLAQPAGVAWHDGALYVSAISRILRYDGLEAWLDGGDRPEPTVVYDAFPTDTHHGWKFIAFGPDDRLHVPVGAPCNVCDAAAERDERFATITSMRPDGSDLRIEARGVRNTVGFDWHPTSGELWFTDNGRDLMGDDEPPCELNVVSETGEHFGFPWCHGTDVADDTFTDRSCAEFTAPVVGFQAHTAPLGMRFHSGTGWGAPYAHDAFVAQHGSWNRSSKVGYRVMRIDFEDGAVVSSEPFVEGWLEGEEAWGRPADVIEHPDGSLYVSDDRAGWIVRVARAD